MSAIPLVSVEEAADFLGVSKRRVQKLCEDERLGQKVGSVYVIPEDELRAFAKVKRYPGRPPQSEES